jgi:hypothetical protein
MPLGELFIVDASSLILLLHFVAVPAPGLSDDRFAAAAAD